MGRIRNIRRVDDDSRRSHAWLVQVQRKNQISTKMFTDNIFGGEEKALLAAIAYRDALVVAAPPVAEHNLWRRTIVRRNNTSGIPGVGRYTRESGAERWIAHWIDEFGKRRSRSFLIQNHGRRKAKQLAVAERKRQLDRIFAIKATQQSGWPNDGRQGSAIGKSE